MIVNNKTYQLTVEQTLEAFNSSLNGLPSDAVPHLKKQFGENVLLEFRQKSRISILFSQFRDTMILILIIAAIISFIAGEHTDSYVILAIILANAWMGYSQEYNAEKSMRQLKKLSPQYTIALRDNHPARIETSSLVPGDMIILNAGDIVPADARLIKVSSLKTDEASLTGESQSAEKSIAAINASDLMPGDQHNMVFKGTQVTNGSAKALVTAIGMNTELGKIATLLKGAEQKTPLQKKLAVFSRQLSVIILIVCAIIFGIGLYRGLPLFHSFLTALSLAVAALPEALPAVITIALASGARRMAGQKALVKNLPAVETLGSVTYICTDKTGTLTQNKMTVEKIVSAPDKEALLIIAMLLNNEVRFAEKELIGDSTETALVEYALKNGMVKAQVDDQYPTLTKLPFDSERMLMSTLHKHQDKWILLVKGAPSKLVEKLSGKYKETSPDSLATNRSWASEGLRVLCFGYRIFDQDPGKISIDIETELDYLGMVAMIDPPRKEVVEAIRECNSAGIKTVMITGDQALTATAISRRLGLSEEGKDGAKTGAELLSLSKAHLSKLVKHISVYARVSPQQKLDIVKALQKNGEFVAMTGDGVNDAPSLKQSDIGIAMGITGTDVSKEAADMILLDDNFATVVKAIREGRRIYDNIRKFISYVLSCNLAEILTILIAPFLGFAIPLLPIHILWINLVTDGLPGMALVAEPAEADNMKRPPRSPKESLFTKGMIKKIMLSGAIMTIAALFIQYWGIRMGYDEKTQQTMVFTTLCFIQLGNALSLRSHQDFIFSRRMFSNKMIWLVIAGTILLQFAILYITPLQTVFKVSYLDFHAIKMIALVTVVCVAFIEIHKFVFRKKS